MNNLPDRRPLDEHQGNEIVAQLHFEVTIDKVRNALELWDTDQITARELLAMISAADAIGSKARWRGWPFLYSRRPA